MRADGRGGGFLAAKAVMGEGDVGGGVTIVGFKEITGITIGIGRYKVVGSILPRPCASGDAAGVRITIADAFACIICLGSRQA